MSKFENIRKALTGQFSVMGLGIDIVYPNAAYEPQSGEPWVRLDILPNQPTIVTLGRSGYDQHTGVMQITLFYPKGETDFPILRMADTIESALQPFIRGSFLTSGNVIVKLLSIGIGPVITDRVSVSTISQSQSWFTVPINVEYRAQIQGNSI